MAHTLRALACLCLLAWVSASAVAAQGEARDAVLLVWGRCEVSAAPLAAHRTQLVAVGNTLCPGTGESFAPLSWAVPRIVARASLLEPQWRRTQLPLLASAACDCLTHIEALAFVPGENGSDASAAARAEGVGAGGEAPNGSIPVVAARVAHCARGTEGAIRGRVTLAARATRLPRIGDHSLLKQASSSEDRPQCRELAATVWDAPSAAPTAPVAPTGKDQLLVAVIEGQRQFTRQASALLRSLVLTLARARGFRETGAVLLLALPGVPASLMDRGVASLEAVGVHASWRAVRPLADDHPGTTAHANKVRALEQPEAQEYRMVLYLDTDTLIASNAITAVAGAVARAGEALQTDTARCWVAGRGGHVPWADVMLRTMSWANIEASLHALRPQWGCDALRPWDWVNTGVLLVLGRCAARLALQWTRAQDALARAMREAGEDPYFLDTLSLLLLGRCSAHGVDVLSWLPPELNLQLNLAQGDFAANAFDEAGPLGPVVAQYAVGTMHLCCRDDDAADPGACGAMLPSGNASITFPVLEKLAWPTILG